MFTSSESWQNLSCQQLRLCTGSESHRIPMEKRRCLRETCKKRKATHWKIYVEEKSQETRKIARNIVHAKTHSVYRSMQQRTRPLKEGLLSFVWQEMNDWWIWHCLYCCSKCQCLTQNHDEDIIVLAILIGASYLLAMPWFKTLICP